MNQQIDNFVKDILAIEEGDYGDFMRRANSYLLHLRSELVGMGMTDVAMKIDEMQNYLQFQPSWQIEATRKRILDDCIYLDDIIRAHKQDWESEVSAS